MLRFTSHHFANRSEFSLKIPTLFEIRAVREAVLKFTRCQGSCAEMNSLLEKLALIYARSQKSWR